MKIILRWSLRIFLFRLNWLFVVFYKKGLFGLKSARFYDPLMGAYLVLDRRPFLMYHTKGGCSLRTVLVIHRKGPVSIQTGPFF